MTKKNIKYNKEISVIIEKDGTLRFLYDYNSQEGQLLSDELIKDTNAHIERRSHINPKVTENGVKWFVDLSPSAGPELGPFESRAIAIEEEIAWINNNWF